MITRTSTTPSLQDLLARHVREFGDLHSLGLRNVIHLNDTHPALAPIELLRLLIDEHGLSWYAAWKITRQAISYTNHTLMPEALETWPVAMFERLLPRHLELIYQLNQHWLDSVRERVPGDAELIARVSLIDEQHGRRVRMAALSIIASHRVNGVAELHSKLMAADHLCRLRQTAAHALPQRHQWRDTAPLAGAGHSGRWRIFSALATASL